MGPARIGSRSLRTVRIREITRSASPLGDNSQRASLVFPLYGASSERSLIVRWMTATGRPFSDDVFEPPISSGSLAAPWPSNLARHDRALVSRGFASPTRARSRPPRRVHGSGRGARCRARASAARRPALQQIRGTIMQALSSVRDEEITVMNDHNDSWFITAPGETRRRVSRADAIAWLSTYPAGTNVKVANDPDGPRRIINPTSPRLTAHHAVACDDHVERGAVLPLTAGSKRRELPLALQLPKAALVLLRRLRDTQSTHGLPPGKTKGVPQGSGPLLNFSLLATLNPPPTTPRCLSYPNGSPLFRSGVFAAFMCKLCELPRRRQTENPSLLVPHPPPATNPRSKPSRSAADDAQGRRR